MPPGTRAGSPGCSCNGGTGVQAHGSYGDYGSKGASVSYSRTTVQTNGSLHTTANAQKAEMQGLNNEMAGFVQRVGAYVIMRLYGFIFISLIAYKLMV